MKLSGIVETALYVDDVPRARDFYKKLFNLDTLGEDDPTGRFAALDVAHGSVLLFFKKGATTTPLPLPGGIIPPHDGTGQLHYAFGIAAADYEGWKSRLMDHGVAIESEVTWPRGGISLYFRDPEGNLGELITPNVWQNY